MEEIYPLTLSYCPDVVPVTVTLKVQLPPAASDPPVNVSKLPPLMTRLPPQVEVVPFGAVSPAGRTSVNAIPVKLRFSTAPLEIVKVNTEVVPSLIGSGEKDLVMVGAGAGMEHPVKLTSLKNASAPELSLFAPVPLIRIVVVPVVLARDDRLMLLVFQASAVKVFVGIVYVAAVPDPLPI